MTKYNVYDVDGCAYDYTIVKADEPQPKKYFEFIGEYDTYEEAEKGGEEYLSYVQDQIDKSANDYHNDGYWDDDEYDDYDDED